MLWENISKIGAVELKSYTFSNLEKTFIAPPLDTDTIARKKNKVRIAYDVSKETAETAKDHAEVKSFKELGETTFNYYLKLEELANEECDSTEL